MSNEKATETSGFLDGRYYTAAFLYEFTALLVGNGVYANELAPTATNENMTITHGSGHAWINGVMYRNTTPFILEIATADGSLNRYDSLMVRLNLSTNETYALIVQGEFAANPVPPAVTRNAETWDLKICDIYIPAGCTKITQDLITDTRLDSAVCGVPLFPIEHLDLSTFYRQIVTDLANFRANAQADFSKWAQDQQNSRTATMDDLVGLVRAESADGIKEINEFIAALEAKGNADTAALLEALNNFKLTEQEKFETWFKEIKGQLSEDAAGNLANTTNALDCLREITKEVFLANSIYPTTPEELTRRRLHQDEAVGQCYRLIQELQYAIETLPVNVNAYTRFAEMLETQANLIKGWRKSDNKFRRAISDTANANSNGNYNANNASNANGVRPDFGPIVK